MKDVDVLNAITNLFSKEDIEKMVNEVAKELAKCENASCTCNEKVCKNEDFKKCNVNLKTPCESNGYKPEEDSCIFDTNNDDYEVMRYVVRIFKAWFKKDYEVYNRLMKSITLEEMQLVEEFAADIIDWFEKEEVDIDLKNTVTLEQKLNQILTERGAKYDWMEYPTLRNLVCTTPDIDAHDPRINEAVNKDFFETSVKKLKNEEDLELDYNDFTGLENYISNNFRNYSISYVNGKVKGKLG